MRSNSQPINVETLEGKLEDIDTYGMPFTKALELVNEGQNGTSDQIPKSILSETSLDMLPSDFKEITDHSMLNKYLMRYQFELKKVCNEITTSQEHYFEEIDLLYEELDYFKKEHERENDSKMKKDINVKDLERKRDELSFKKSKLVGKLKYYESMNDIFNSKLSFLDTKLKKWTERKSQIIKHEEKDRSEVEMKITKLKIESEQIKSNIDELEDRLKHLVIKRKEVHATLDKLETLAEEFDKEVVFSKEGTLTLKGQEIVNEILNMFPEWTDEITSELLNSFNFESNWKSTFKFEIRKYLSLQHSFEMTKASKEKNYQPNKLSEYQASIEFGGFGNALSKKLRRVNSPPPLSMSNSDDVPQIPGTRLNEQLNHYNKTYSQELDFSDFRNTSQSSFQGDRVFLDPEMNNSGSFRSFSEEKINFNESLPQFKEYSNDVNTEMSPVTSSDPQFNLQNQQILNNVWVPSGTSVGGMNFKNSMSTGGFSHSHHGLGFGYNSYGDANGVLYSKDQILNPVLDNGVAGLNGRYFQSPSTSIELSDSNSLGGVPAGASLTNYISLQPSHGHQTNQLNVSAHSLNSPKDFGNLWLDGQLAQLSRGIASNSHIWRNTGTLGSRTFNMGLFNASSIHNGHDDNDQEQI